jgi:hypothetical protein
VAVGFSAPVPDHVSDLDCDDITGSGNDSFDIGLVRFRIRPVAGRRRWMRSPASLGVGTVWGWNKTIWPTCSDLKMRSAEYPLVGYERRFHRAGGNPVWLDKARLDRDRKATATSTVAISSASNRERGLESTGM